LIVPMKTADLCQLAADLALEHGTGAIEIAQFARISLEVDGQMDRAKIWKMLSVLLDDIFAQRLDPDLPLVIH
jgi:hypothetical protein